MAMRETIGIVAPVPKDLWNNKTEYQCLNIVRYNGSAYIAKKGSEGVEPGVSSHWNEYWAELVKDGGDSDSGKIEDLTEQLEWQGEDISELQESAKTMSRNIEKNREALNAQASEISELDMRVEKIESQTININKINGGKP